MTSKSSSLASALVAVVSPAQAPADKTKTSHKRTSVTKQNWYATAGDLAHLSSIASTMVFCYLVVSHMNDPNDKLLDPVWKQHGFCITAPDEAFWTSHDVCLYVDVAAAAVLGGVYLLLRKTPGLELANELMLANLPGLIGHGIGHGSVAASGRAERDDSFKAGQNYTANSLKIDVSTGWELIRNSPDLSTVFWQYAFLVIFWMGLLKSTFSKSSVSTVALIMLPIIAIQLLLVTGNYGFTYVQTVLMICFSLKELAQRPLAEKENVSYPLFATIVTLPVSFVGWMETTQCTNFVKDFLYGHVVYDAYIPLSILIWYVLCYAHAKSAGQVHTAKAKTA